jgi:hypothetical protein
MTNGSCLGANLVVVEANPAELVKAGAGKEGLGLELKSHGEGRDYPNEGDVRAPLAGRQGVAAADLVSGVREGPLGVGLHRENLRIAEENNRRGCHGGAVYERQGQSITIGESDELETGSRRGGMEGGMER